MKIHGTYGDIPVNIDTGEPLKKITIPEYADIVRFDVKEYQLFYFKDAYPPDGIDILDIGYLTDKDKIVRPDSVHREMVEEGGTRVIVTDGPDGSEKDSFTSGHDQPTTCPECGARSDFEEVKGKQMHTCLGCGYEFTLEFEKEEEEPEPEEMSVGEALAVLIDYAEQDLATKDDDDMEDWVKEYTRKVRRAVEVANREMDQSWGLFDKYLKERFTE